MLAQIITPEIFERFTDEPCIVAVRSLGKDFWPAVYDIGSEPSWQDNGIYSRCFSTWRIGRIGQSMAEHVRSGGTCYLAVCEDYDTGMAAAAIVRGRWRQAMKIDQLLHAVVEGGGSTTLVLGSDWLTRNTAVATIVLPRWTPPRPEYVIRNAADGGRMVDVE